jgi:hypothetical protein
VKRASAEVVAQVALDEAPACRAKGSASEAGIKSVE